jgi:uncharacterized membrane protein YdjX (TVP38/TMEM64 family)
MRWRLIIIAAFIVLGIAAFATMLMNPTGRQLLNDPQQTGQHVRQWVLANPVTAEVAILVAYILLTLIAMPVWWINVLAGYSYGLVGGTIRCTIAAAIAAAISAHLWTYLAGDLVHSGRLTRYRIIRLLESYATKYGFGVVLVTRLARLLPFGLGNYVFGMLEITWPRVFAGTLIGIIPSIATYVAIGASADWRKNLPFIVIIAILTLGGIVTGAYLYLRHARQTE